MEETNGLEGLADELIRRAWVAKIRQRGKRPVLEVSNPKTDGTRLLTEIVTCDGETYTLPGGQAIGQVSDVVATADQVQRVLRNVGQ
ncbi:hypothetical protein [Actinoallomurus iriomotensis]|uniref:Uncharacterized protein n=1 Tax=Actinoallomurus iriomotensis TaxID=478107 RepID=A0A9W6S2E7_9ACTN|nr:hypothetical protein [Actinoallomurus iriomotensis]GLY86011.1 hypothetical protein Airi02_039400 [Actinoallomurus iriomotensis]